MYVLPVRLLCFAFCLSWSITAFSQTPAAIDPLVARASQAFSAGKAVTSVEMTGTAEWTAGSTKDSGPAKLTANVNGENKAEFDLSNGTRIENQSAVGDSRTCTWIDKDGIAHDMSLPNCWKATTWFLPHLALQTASRPSQLRDASSAFAEKSNAGSLHIEHRIVLDPPAKQSTEPFVKLTSDIQTWSKTDMTVDSVTSLPATLKYMLHPDGNSFANVLVEVRYSKYQNISGIELPMHIERYVNGALQLSIDIDSAVIN